jgi:hypothetical protein
VSAAPKGAQISVWQRRTARTPNAVAGKGKGQKAREVDGRQSAVTSRKESAILRNLEVIGVAEIESVRNTEALESGGGGS